MELKPTTSSRAAIPKPSKFDHNDNVTMEPGTYYLDGKGLEFRDTSNLAAFGVTIYSASKKDLRFQSAGSLVLTPPTSGTYAGISLFQSPTARGKISFKKDAHLDIQGAIYAPN